MKVNLTKMQNKVNKVTAVFTNIIKELSIDIGTLQNAIEENNDLIAEVEAENRMYISTIDEYEALKNKVESIIN